MGPDISQVMKGIQELLDQSIGAEPFKIGDKSRARVRLAIEDVLDQGLPRSYTKDLFATICNSLFEHVFESYQGEGRSAFTEAA